MSVEDGNHRLTDRESPGTWQVHRPEFGCRAAPGYDTEALATLPPDAVAGSTGCGDPVAEADLAIGDVVLDLGSGTGIDVILAARKVGPSGHVCGIDNSPEMVALARSATDAAAVGNVEIRNGLMEALPISAASIDWVIANCAINQSADKPQVFAEIARVLRLGGRLRIADVFADGLGDWVGGDASLRGSCLAGAATEAECIAGLTRVGLADLAVGGRYVYDQVQLAAMVAGPSERPTDRLRAADFAAAAVGGVWRAYVNARKPEKKTTAQAGSASQQTASGSVAQRKGARRHDRLP